MKKILLIRTDKIGDVVLTTPCIKIVRDHFPMSHIAFMTGPKTQELIEGNPYINELIIYDKKEKHKSIFQTFKFSQELRKKKFDAAIIFNPTNRTHWVSFLAKIPMRIGYTQKAGFLLTHTLEDRKHEGLKSEAFYNEDLLSFLSIKPPHSRDLFLPVVDHAIKKIDALLIEKNIQSPFIVINVSASDTSRIWPAQNFALLCQLISEQLNLKILLIGNKEQCAQVNKASKIPLTILAETLTLQELIALSKKTSLHISSDTGPLHVASAVGAPLITIFGRTLPGLGPKRWSALKGQNIIFHKDIGCNPCLAHQCKLNFDCFKATKVEEVFNAVKSYAQNFNC